MSNVCHEYHPIQIDNECTHKSKFTFDFFLLKSYVNCVCQENAAWKDKCLWKVHIYSYFMSPGWCCEAALIDQGFLSFAILDKLFAICAFA